MQSNIDSCWLAYIHSFRNIRSSSFK